jgi:hypothetical protein
MLVLELETWYRYWRCLLSMEGCNRERCRLYLEDFGTRDTAMRAWFPSAYLGPRSTQSRDPVAQRTTER